MPVTSFYGLKTPRLESYNAKDPGHKSCQDRLIKLLDIYWSLRCILYGWGRESYRMHLCPASSTCIVLLCETRSESADSLFCGELICGVLSVWWCFRTRRAQAFCFWAWGVSCHLLRPGLNLTFSSVTDRLNKKLDLHQS